jgi:hypothetical protein
MKWFDFQEDLKKNAINHAKRMRPSRRGKKPRVVDSVGIPLTWLLESSAKLKRRNKSKYLHIIVTEKAGIDPRTKKRKPRRKAKVLIPGVDYELYIEGYGYQSPTLGNKIGICEEFPPKMWP